MTRSIGIVSRQFLSLSLKRIAHEEHGGRSRVQDKAPGNGVSTPGVVCM